MEHMSRVFRGKGGITRWANRLNKKKQLRTDKVCTRYIPACSTGVRCRLFGIPRSILDPTEKAKASFWLLRRPWNAAAFNGS